jgi:hypothetical protein
MSSGIVSIKDRIFFNIGMDCASSLEPEEGISAMTQSLKSSLRRNFVKFL